METCIVCGRDCDGSLFVRAAYVCSTMCGAKRDAVQVGQGHGDATRQLDVPDGWEAP